MRLWPLEMLQILPRQQLLGQHRECCALRGLGWGRKHSTVDYVFRHPYILLFEYHRRVMEEMLRRKYRIDEKWWDPAWRGHRIGYDYLSPVVMEAAMASFDDMVTIYPEHDDKYFKECMDNLARKISAKEENQHGKGKVLHRRSPKRRRRS